MTDKPENKDSDKNTQDMDLEAQLDALLSDLEEVDPQSVPADLRKKPGNAGAKPVEPRPEPEPVAEAEPEAQPVAADAEPVPAPTTEIEEQEEEPPAQPMAASEDSSQAKKPKMGLDLETIASMASNLLDEQIESTIESASNVIDRVEGEAKAEADAAATEQAAKESTEAAFESKTGGAVDNDVLGEQLAALMQDMQTMNSETEAEAEQAEAVSQTSAVVEASVEADDLTASMESASELEDEPGAVSIEQIDAMLAESAEQALASGDESDQPVPGTDEILAAQAEAEDRAAEESAQAMAAVEAQPEPVTTGQVAEPEPAPIPTEAVTEAAEAPQPVPVQSFDASAEDVARELDNDSAAETKAAIPAPKPVPVAAQAVASTNVSQQAVADASDDNAGQEQDGPVESEMVIKESGLAKAERMLLRLCRRINHPLQRLSPEMRDTVGYVGILTTAVALFMIAFGLIF